MANNSDEVKKGKQLGNIVDLLVTAKVELDDLTSEVYTLQRAQKPQESDLRQIGVILGDIVKEIRELKSDVTLSKLGVAMKVPPKLDRKG
jgi:predicted  nucleic acid-binding Zn-ribbon protein